MVGVVSLLIIGASMRGPTPQSRRGCLCDETPAECAKSSISALLVQRDGTSPLQPMSEPMSARCFESRGQYRSEEELYEENRNRFAGRRGRADGRQRKCL